MLNKTLCMILAGGVGSRLAPLTNDRAKPAVPFAGKYRIIDFTLSNCLHSGLRRVLVLTQYKSHSLQKHLRDGWSIFNPEVGEYITPVPPQMRTGSSWYEGTADAIYQNLYLVERSEAEYVMILSGDHIYRMDYAAMLEYHKQNNCDLTVACMEVPVEEARSFGVMNVDRENHVLDFQEKPENPRPLPKDPTRAMASMGIYVFNAALMCEELEIDHKNSQSHHDFGRNIIPKLIETHRVFAYKFGGSSGRVSCDRYWKDVGTVDGYFESNMDLLRPVPPLDLYQDDWPIRTYHGQNPPARIVPGESGWEGEMVNSILGAGTVIAGGLVRRSILASKVVVNEGAKIEASILFDGVTVGEGAKLRRCIIDKGVNIPAGETIGYDPNKDAQRFTISEKGITVVSKDYKFASETQLSLVGPS